MSKHIKHIIQGASRVLVLIPEDKYVVPSKSGFYNDARALRTDSKKIARDLNRTTKAYGK